ncbi:MAG: AmmeMemoRadiSam system protein B [Spirochaetia bacterium]|jgi:AmmeMemoRadiSam system protein B|nr:AmmeMemoRadiSam system protein B [Spirochaetia bacterium]
MNEKTRKRILPDGWYPGSKNDVLEILEKWDKKKKLEEKLKAKSVIVPHAGWAFSGETAFQAFSAIPRDVETIVIAGGHLGVNDRPLAAKEETYNATIGTVKSDLELLSFLSDETTFYLDSYPDNTVEINLPIIKYLFPECKVLWLRMPANYEIIIKIARNIYDYSENHKKKIAVAGSTDLTHYGYNYGFHPHGTGKEGLEWVKKVNDREFIDYISEYQIERAIEHSRTNMSACSAGAAGLAAEYALLKKCKNGKLLSYHTSYDISPADSFVGYAGIIFA